MSSSSSVIGLTGGIGCGKTTVVREFQRLGIPCFVADDWAKKVYDVPAFLAEVAVHFGGGILAADGTLDRKALAAIVFSDADALAWLNDKVHPQVDTMFEAWRRQQAAPYLLYESAIIYEAHLEHRFDKIITVYLDREERIRRTMERDHADRATVARRIDSQMSAEEKMRRADYVILNYEGNPRRRQVEHIHNIIMNT